jgi:hypothetical protein
MVTALLQALLSNAYLRRRLTQNRRNRLTQCLPTISPAGKIAMLACLRFVRRTLGVCLLAAFGSGCSAVPALDDAKLISVEIAKPADLARLNQAREQVVRNSFAGATIRDPQQEVLTFSD